MKIRGKLGFSLLLFCCLQGCSLATMSVPQSLASTAEPMAVTGANPRTWNRPVGFGQWRTTDVREGLRWGFGARIAKLDASFFRQAYKLVLEDGSGETVQAECVTRALAVERDGWSVDPAFGALPALACGFVHVGTGEEWSLVLKPRGTRLAGVVETEEGEWSIATVHSLEGSSIPTYDPVGYELTDRGHPVAAVEILNRGRVWIPEGIDSIDQSRAASIAAVLLIYEPPSELD